MVDRDIAEVTAYSVLSAFALRDVVWWARLGFKPDTPNALWVMTAQALAVLVAAVALTLRAAQSQWRPEWANTTGVALRASIGIAVVLC